VQGTVVGHRAGYFKTLHGQPPVTPVNILDRSGIKYDVANAVTP
jgi:hypothetical protein